MDYILKIASWYPNKNEPFNGDFVQRHAKAIALYQQLFVIFGTEHGDKNLSIIEEQVSENLHETRFYYPKSRIGFLRRFFIGRRLLLDLIKKNGKPSLVHLAVVWPAGLLALWAKWFLKTEYIITEHWSGLNPNDRNNLHKTNFLKRFLFRKIVNNAAWLTPVSDDLANSLKKWNPNYTVIPNVVDTSLFNYLPKASNEVINLIHISGLGYEKNIVKIIDVLARLNKSYKFVFKIIGPPNHEVIRNSSKYDFIELVGEIEYTKVAEHLKKADVLVMFSLFENLPCTILEALCSGVPVVSSDVGGINEVVDAYNGILVEAKNEEELEKAVEIFLKKEFLINAAQISNKAIERFGYSVVGKQYFDIYKKIIDVQKKH